MNFELLKARKESKLTQEELANLASIERNRYSRIELGKTKANIEEALKLAIVLNKKADEIFLVMNADNISKNKQSA